MFELSDAQKDLKQRAGELAKRTIAPRAAAVDELRSIGQPTVPTMIALEKATNPFLRAGDAGLRAHLGMEGASDAEVFAEVRRRKDNF